MLREEKINVVKDLTQDFSEYSSLIVTHYHGLSVKQMTDLRSELFNVGVKFVVVKNKLMKIALRDTEFARLDSVFSGPTAVILSNDPIAVAKVLVKFVSENEALKLIKGFVYGAEINPEGIKTLSKMPSLDELRAKLIALLQTPATSLASVLTAPAGNLARVVSAYSLGKGE